MNSPLITISREVNPRSGLPKGLLRLEYQSAVDGAPDWALLQPPSRGKRWIVCIHGHGSGGDQLWITSNPRMTTWRPIFEKLGCGILSPHLRGNSWMGPAVAEDLRGLLAVVRGKYGATHFDFVSGSMGGTSNLIYAGLHPADVASIVALCAATDLATYYDWCRNQNKPILTEIADAIEKSYGGTPLTKPDLFTAHSTLANVHKLTMPVFIAHGTADEIIPISQLQPLAAAMAGAKSFHHEEIPGGDHDAPLPGVAHATAWVRSQLEN